MKAGAVVVVSAVVIGSIACGPPARHDVDANGGRADSGNTSGGDAGDGCSAAAKLVYTIDQFSNKLATFDPMTKTFHDLGALACPTTGGATPFSMGVDRNATAYVLYNSGELFRVDTSTLACAKTSWVAQAGLKVFGMGFSTDTSGGTTDSLFVGGGQSQTQSSFTLGRVDVTTMIATALGSEPELPEMTGTGTAQLWGYFPGTTTARVLHIDKTNGTAIKTFSEPTLGGGGGAGYAFAFWGGDFWVFLIRPGDPETRVYQVDGTTGTVKGSSPSGGRTIVGAGVSTCAPVVLQ
jgi:hypothetical protein